MKKKNYKKLYYAQKATGTSIMQLKRSDLAPAEGSDLISRIERGRYYSADEMRSILFGENYKDEEFINRIEKVSNDDIYDKLNVIQKMVKKIVNHTKMSMAIFIGLSIFYIVLFIYGKITLDTLLDRLL